MTLQKVIAALAGTGLFVAGVWFGVSALTARAQTPTPPTNNAVIATAQPATQEQSDVKDSSTVSETVDLTDSVDITDTVEVGHHDEVSGTVEVGHPDEISGTVEMTDTVEMTGTLGAADSHEGQNSNDLDKPGDSNDGQKDGGNAGDAADSMDTAALVAQATVTQQQAEATALAANLGKTVIKIELDEEHGAVVYKVLLSDKSHIAVDAKTGQIVKEQNHTEVND